MQINLIFRPNCCRRGRNPSALALAALLVFGVTAAKGAECTSDLLSSILLPTEVPVTLFVNPNGNTVTPPELNEIQTAVINIRATLGAVAAFESVKDPLISGSLDIAVGANVRMNGYSFISKTFRAQTKKAGNVFVSFAIDRRSTDCRIFWMRVAMPVQSQKPSNKDHDDI